MATTKSQQSQNNNNDTTNDVKNVDSKSHKLQAVTTTTVQTASGYEQNLRDAPASITIIPREEIMTRPIRDVGDAVQDVPGVYTEQDKTGQNTISMRGLSSTYTLILIDGKRQNTAQGFISNGLGNATSFMPPASMIERIEVIRGPASILYGSDAMGGVINIITKKHADKLTMGAQMESKFFEREEFGNVYGGNAYLTTPLIKKILSLNLRGGYRYNGQNGFLKPSWVPMTDQDTDGHRGPNPYVSHSSTGSQNWNAGFRLNYTPDTHNTIYLDSEVYNGRFGSLNTSASSFTSVQEMYKNNNVLSHEADYDWGKLDTYLQYSYTVIASHGTNNPYPNPAPNPDDPLQGLAPGSSKGDFINWDKRRENHNITFQTNYKNTFDFGNWGKLIFNGGLYYMYESLQNYQTSFSRSMNQFAVFAEGDYMINDYVSTTLGLRYNYSDIFKAIPNPRFYVNVHPLDWLTIKTGIASGVLVPALSYLYEGYIEGNGNPVIHTYGNTNLLPETSWNYELSAMVDTKYVGLILTGYYTDFNNKIETKTYEGGICAGGTHPGQCRIYENINKSFVTGAETIFQLKPIYGFSLDASYSFTYTERLDGDYKGDVINEIPRHSFTIMPKYRFKNFDMYIRWNGRFQTPTSPSATAARQNVRDIVGKWYKDYQLVDIAATYKFFQHYYITFAINNLFDVYFMDYIAVSSGSSLTPQNTYQRILPSRNYWLTLRVEF
ncbi:ferric enterobactin uptake receptor [Helicobacter didelphidarum]|uniref:Ferric enterobactin uptake receptor n=2 Tax=Helicobacter didelphidarum TaxID=2040648 RepID=A0A3D8IGC1_9HELI|nr:ferric enterobactin uptake receptor [Helicobacter didelphidarum]